MEHLGDRTCHVVGSRETVHVLQVNVHDFAVARDRDGGVGVASKAAICNRWVASNQQTIRPAD